MRLTSLSFVLAALTAQAQIISFGVKAGAPLTDAHPHHFADNSTIDTGRWTVGPTIEFRLIRGFSIEFDALYRGYKSTSAYLFTDPAAGILSSWHHVDTKAWDLPLLLKYRFAAGRLRPFLSGGYSATHESSDVTWSLNCLEDAAACGALTTYPTLGTDRTEQDSRFRRGPVAALGIEFKYRRITIVPEIRYSRLNNPNTNQATVLLGVLF